VHCPLIQDVRTDLTVNFSVDKRFTNILLVDQTLDILLNCWKLENAREMHPLTLMAGFLYIYIKRKSLSIILISVETLPI
jgi:hypothetical protein